MAYDMGVWNRGSLEFRLGKMGSEIGKTGWNEILIWVKSRFVTIVLILFNGFSAL